MCLRQNPPPSPATWGTTGPAVTLYVTRLD